MTNQKIFDTGLLYHHYANTAYPLTPKSFMEYKLHNPDAIMKLLREDWGKASEMSLYVHIPFCQSRCKFCEYVVLENPTMEIEDEYADLLLQEMKIYASIIGDKPIVGYDMGGGTPLKLSIKNLTRITEAVFDNFNILPEVTCSIETTPPIAAHEPEKLKIANQIGYHRISMGIQTVSARLLAELGREGEPQIYEQAVKNIRKAGFKQFNVDLMYGFLHQSDNDLENTLKYAIALNPDFITLYRNRYKGTKIESEAGGVSLYKAMRQYRLAFDLLTANGYMANIGKNTFSRISENYGTSDYLTNRVINGTPYLGLGLGAQSFGMNYLAYNEGAANKKLERYREALRNGQLPLQDIYALPLEETVAKMVSVAFYFGFIDSEAFKKRFGVKFEKFFADEISFVIQKGLMKFEGTRLTLTPRGSDYINGVIPLFYSQRSKEELIRLYEGDHHESEDESVFLSTYRIEDYDRPSVTTDVVAMTLRTGDEPTNSRKRKEEHLSILLIKRGEHPYMNCWALPGGFLRRGETVEHCAQRELFEETGLNTDALFSLGCFSSPRRDPRGWIISNAFLSIVNKEDNILARSGDDAIDARWFELSYQIGGDRLSLTLFDGDLKFTSKLRIIPATYGEPHYELIDGETGPGLAFDHAVIIANAISRLRSEAGLRQLAFAFLPAHFTFAELQNLHEKLLNTKLSPPVFRKKQLPLLEETAETISGGRHRPARLFRRKKSDEA